MAPMTAADSKATENSMFGLELGEEDVMFGLELEERRKEERACGIAREKAVFLGRLSSGDAAKCGIR